MMIEQYKPQQTPAMRRKLLAAKIILTLAISFLVSVIGAGMYICYGPKGLLYTIAIVIAVSLCCWALHELLK